MKDETDDTDEDGDGSGGGGVIPGYHELFRIDANEKDMAKFAATALDKQRIDIKSKGYEVTALSKMQKLRHQLQEPGMQQEGGGLGLEGHPELPELGGDVDPNIIVLPDSELSAEQIRNNPQLRNKLAAKLGMGMGMSMQSMREEYKKKMSNRAQPKPAPQPQPRYRPVSTPKPKPS